MGLFDKFKNKNVENEEEKEKTALPVKESIETVISMINDHFSDDGWRFIKGSRKLKKTVGILDFEVHFFLQNGIKWANVLKLNVLRMLYVKNIKDQNHILGYKYYPLDSELAMEDRRSPYGNSYYDITYKENFDNVIKDITYQLSNTIVLLAQNFENDFEATGIQLAEEGKDFVNKLGNTHWVNIQFIADYISKECALSMAKKYLNNINETEKEELQNCIKLYEKDEEMAIRLCNEDLMFIIKNYKEIT